MMGRRGVLAGVGATAAATKAYGQAVTVLPTGKVPNLFSFTGKPAVIDPPCGPIQGTVNVTEFQRKYRYAEAPFRAAMPQEFLGIPYAAPPIGALRYAPPQPMPRWSKPRDGSRGGAAAIQTLGGAAAWLYETPPAESEDCLFLNVWTPDVAGKRPVMVWIHGGAWRTGRGDAAGTVGARLAAQGDVVVVTINYRLGALGWLAHPALAEAGGPAANWGLQDQVAALRWVQTNIAAFGGDPGNVTLFGQSAGGSSTASIAGDKRNAGLMHKAILESGSLHGAPAFPEMDTAAAYTEALAKRLGITVPGLRGLPARQVHEAELALARDPTMVRALGRPPVLPVLDGTVLTQWPRDVTLGVPAVIGTTRTEGTFWFDLVGPDGKLIPGLKSPATMEELGPMIAGLAALYRPEAVGAAPQMAAVYAAAARERGTSEVPKDLWVAAYTDLVFRLRARDLAMRQAKAGQPTWLYEFAQPLVAPAHGVPHTSEIPFVFGTNADPFFADKVGAGPAQATLADAMLGAWSRFAHTGEPGPGWTRTAGAGPAVNVLGGGAAFPAVEDGVRMEEVRGWGA